MRYRFALTRKFDVFFAILNTETLRYTSKDICKVLIGNKQDLEPLREVTTEDAQTMADIHGMLTFLETSAKESTNVNEVIDQLF